MLNFSVHWAHSSKRHSLNISLGFWRRLYYMLERLWQPFYTMLRLSSCTCMKAAFSNCLPWQLHTVYFFPFCTEIKFFKQIFCGLISTKAVNCKSRTGFVFCEIAVEAAGSETLMASFSFDRRTCWKGQSWDSTHLWLDVSSCWPQTIKMELPWKLIVLLSLVECVAGKHPPPFFFHKCVLFLCVDGWCGYKLSAQDLSTMPSESCSTWKQSPLLR